MPRCIIIGCNTYNGRRLPKDPELLEKWLESINRTDYKPTPNSIVCLKHFRKSDFIPDSENKDKVGRYRKLKRLKPKAIPSCFLSNDPLDTDDNDDESEHEAAMDSPKSLDIKPDFVTEMSASNNPWNVADASVFLQYCCPECEYSHPKLNDFSETKRDLGFYAI